MKMESKPFYHLCHFTRRDGSLEAGPGPSLLPLTLDPNELTHFCNLPRTPVRFRSMTVAAFPSHCLTSVPPQNFFLNLVRFWTVPKLPLLPVRQEDRLHWHPGMDRGLGETESLRQGAKDPWFSQHQSCFLLLPRGPHTESCQAKRSVQAPRNSIKITALTLPGAKSWKSHTRDVSPAPVQPLNPSASQPPTQSPHPPFLSPRLIFSPLILMALSREKGK